jgi:hypothetical protein
MHSGLRTDVDLKNRSALNIGWSVFARCPGEFQGETWPQSSCVPVLICSVMNLAFSLLLFFPRRKVCDASPELSHDE